MTERYRIELACELDEEWSSWLGNLELTHSPAGHTVLTGDLPNQAALHGLLARIRDLGVPINLALRYLLELAALLALGVWGWQQSESWLRFVLAIAGPIIAAAVWGTFNVPHDPSRSGAAPVAVPGMLLLAIELALFLSAVLALYDSGYASLSWALGIIVAIHYIASYDRIRWLMTH